MSKFTEIPYIELVLGEVSSENKALLLKYINGKDGSNNDLTYTLKTLSELNALNAGVYAVVVPYNSKIQWKGYFVKTSSYKVFLTFKTGIDLTKVSVYKTGTADFVPAGEVASDYIRSLLREDSYIDPVEMAAGNGNLENGSGENSLQQKGNTASGKDSFAHGLNNIASNIQTHAEGNGTQAVGNFAHSEGQANVAWADISHAEGVGNIVGNTNETEVRSTGEGSHAEGYGNIVFGKYAHVSGRNNIVWKNYSTVVGEFNNDASTAIFAVGNGTDNAHRSNAFEVYTDGTIKVNGQALSGGAKLYLYTITIQNRGTLYIYTTNGNVPGSGEDLAIYISGNPASPTNPTDRGILIMYFESYQVLYASKSSGANCTIYYMFSDGTWEHKGLMTDSLFVLSFTKTEL